jgi:glycosyltransferase involved in cell wall biosynthesis
VFAVDLGDALADLGHQVKTVALAPGSTTPALLMPTLGVSPLHPSTLRQLRREARRVDVVVAHGSRTLPACALALVGSTPFVYRNIGDPSAWSRSGLRHLRTRLFLARAAAVVALTTRAADTLSDDYRVDRSNLVVIPTGAPGARHPRTNSQARAAARSALGIPPMSPVAAVIGGLSEEKNVSLALEAAERVPELHVIIAGDGPARATLEAEAAVRTPDRTHFTGGLSDPSRAFDAADVVVLSSRTEGLPGVLIEAGLRGLPSVTTDVGYVRDIVLDEVTGLVVSSRDVDAMAEGIVRALATASSLGARAYEHCTAEYELGRISTRWNTLLERTSR